MKRALIITVCAILATVLLFTSVWALFFRSPAPDIEEVRAIFADLIENSFEINDIFFGEGLPTYARPDPLKWENDEYDEELEVYYNYITDSESGKTILRYSKKGDVTKGYTYLEVSRDDNGTSVGHDNDGNYYYPSDYTEKPSPYDSESPEKYDYVTVDCEYQSIESIKKAAEAVYSSSYLSSVYSSVFDGIYTDYGTSYARYKQSETLGDSFFLKSNEFEPFFSSQSVYDISSMRIVKPSNAKSVNVSIDAEGTYYDATAGKLTEGKYTRTLRFVFEGGAWRLDTPTY